MATPSQKWDKKNIAVPLGPSMQDNPGTNQKPAKNLPWQVFWQVPGCSIIDAPHIISLKKQHQNKYCETFVVFFYILLWLYLLSLYTFEKLHGNQLNLATIRTFFFSFSKVGFYAQCLLWTKTFQTANFLKHYKLKKEHICI